MGDITFASLLVSFILSTVILAGAPLVAATVLGIIISIFQAVTQIQDQTLSTTVKIFAIAFVMLSFGTTLLNPLFVLSVDLFDNFATIRR